MTKNKSISIIEKKPINSAVFYDMMKRRFDGMRRSRRTSFYNLRLNFKQLVQNKQMRKEIVGLMSFLGEAFPKLFDINPQLNRTSFIRHGLVSERQSQQIYRRLILLGVVNRDTGLVVKDKLNQNGLNSDIINMTEGLGLNHSLVSDTLLNSLISEIDPINSYSYYQESALFIIQDNTHHLNDYIRELQNAVTLAYCILPTMLTVFLNGQLNEFRTDDSFSYTDNIGYGLDSAGQIMQIKPDKKTLSDDVQKIFSAKAIYRLHGTPWPVGAERASLIKSLSKTDFNFMKKVFSPTVRNRGIEKYLFKKQLTRSYNQMNLQEETTRWLHEFILDIRAYYYYQDNE